MSDTPETQEAIERWRQGKINIFDEMARLERERNEAIASRKASAAEWLINVEQANARATRALQQTALAERERDEARESLRAARDRCQKIGRQRNRLNAENERLIKKAMPPHTENPETE